jgi:hypothetical protein
MKIESKKIGHWDKGNRFYINEDYHTASSRAVRAPSRAWPHSEYKHIFTKKYAKQLAEKLGVDSIEVVK